MKFKSDRCDKSGTAGKRRGRPPAFNREEVLEKAARLFWSRGYEGTSIADLTRAMGITPQSLYAAFHSKADLYREALKWYGSTQGTLSADALDAPDVLETLAAWLDSQASAFAEAETPPGCMISTAVLGCAEENDPIARQVSYLRTATITRIRDRLERARSEGELAAGTDTTAIARFVGAIIQGMSVQARDGATHSDLAAVARLASIEIRRHRAARTHR
ncbi:TetR/AcrR family transcriptional regulator [Amaricoccus macauensis]|uniref:TetR/AcrR family transcriptional regulator n=1 Tax=Amaricoccus macauensis TaxID=57001 RepID=UPI003C7D6A56